MSDAFERAVRRADTERGKRRRERSARAQRKAFRIHASAFVAVQVLIVAIWAVQWQTGGTSYPWFVYPLLGWGVALAVHFSAVHENLRSRAVEPPSDRAPCERSD